MTDLRGDDDANDSSLPRDTKLLRRIAPGQVKEGDPERKPRSDAFSNSPDGSGTSVDIWEDGREPADMLVGHEKYGLVEFTVGDVRDADLGVIRVPLPGNRHHAHLQGKKSRGRLRKLSKACRWIKFPDDEDGSG